MALARAASVEGTAPAGTMARFSRPVEMPRPEVTVIPTGAPGICVTVSALPTRSTIAIVAGAPRAVASLIACSTIVLTSLAVRLGLVLLAGAAVLGVIEARLGQEARPQLDRRDEMRRIRLGRQVVRQDLLGIEDALRAGAEVAIGAAPLVVEYDPQRRCGLGGNPGQGVGGWSGRSRLGRHSDAAPLHARRRRRVFCALQGEARIVVPYLSLIHISEPTRQAEISYAVFCLKKKKKKDDKKDDEIGR